MNRPRVQRFADHPSLFRARGNPARRPRVAALLPRLLVALDGRGWVSARRLVVELDTDDRAIREAASNSGGRILGSRLGYCRTEQASLREVQRVTRWLLSQSGRMRSRVIEIERVRHAIDGPEAWVGGGSGGAA